MADIIQKEYNAISIKPFGFTYNTNFKDISYYRMSKISKIIKLGGYDFRVRSRDLIIDGESKVTTILRDKKLYNKIEKKTSIYRNFTMLK